MNILVIDGQGGQLGGQLIKSLKANFQNIKIMAVGTNATATATMLKAGADQAATGENPVMVACKKTDMIIGPIGIVIADALFGEITPKMAVAVDRQMQYEFCFQLTSVIIWWRGFQMYRRLQY